MKKLNIFFSIALLGVLTASFEKQVLADEIGTEANPAKGTATIEFTDNTGVTDPKDPEDPTKPNPNLPDSNNTTTGANGPLSLDVVPNEFNFGTHVISYGEGIYNSNAAAGIKHYIQVTDNRDDLGGWSISMSRTEFTDGANTLNGSQLYIPSGIARNNLSASSTIADPNITLGETSEVNGFEGMHSISTTESTLFSAADNIEDLVGKGTTIYSWDASDEKLSIPAGSAKKGTFTSTINWVLNATPVK